MNKAKAEHPTFNIQRSTSGCWGWVVGLVLVMAWGGRAWGYIALPLTEVSLEWRVEEADLIVRGTVGPGAQRDVVVGGKNWREVSLEVDETMKGKRLGRLTFLMGRSEGLAKADGSWSDVLVFLKRVEGDVRANVSSGRLGRWEAEKGLVIVLGSELPRVLRMDGTEVADGEKLLEATREASGFASKRGTKARGYSLWLRSEILVVPWDVRLEELGRRWIEAPAMNRRLMGVNILSDFPSPENLARLKNLMKDPEFAVIEREEWSPALEWRATKEYPVRKAAQEHVTPGLGELAIEPYLRYVPVAWGRWAVGLGLILAVAALWPGRWGRLGVGGRLAVVCAGLAVMVGVLWCQTQWERKSFSYARGGADYEVVSYGGRVGLLRVQDDAAGHGWMVRRDGAELSGEWLWFASMLRPAETAGVKGVSCSEGKTADASAYSYRLVTLNYLWVVVGLLGWPTVWRVGRLRLAGRRKRWARENRCAGCGYDLRGHPVEVRCPECGVERRVNV